MNGKIKRLIVDKGFGFLEGEDKKEYFFHQSALRNSRFETLQEGDAVTFTGGSSAKGLRAEDVLVAE